MSTTTPTATSPRRPRSAWSAASVLARLKRVPDVDPSSSSTSSSSGGGGEVCRLDIQSLEALAFPLRSYLFRMLFRALEQAQQRETLSTPSSSPITGDNTDNHDVDVSSNAIDNNDDDDSRIEETAGSSPVVGNDEQTLSKKAKRIGPFTTPKRKLTKLNKQNQLQPGILDAFWNERQTEKRSEAKEGMGTSQRQARQRAFAELFMRLVAQQLKAVGGLTPLPTSLDLLSSNPTACLRALDWLLYRRARLLVQPAAKARPSPSKHAEFNDDTDVHDNHFIDTDTVDYEMESGESLSFISPTDKHKPVSFSPKGVYTGTPTRGRRRRIGKERADVIKHRGGEDDDSNVESGDLAKMSHRDLYMHARDLSRTNTELASRNAELESMLARVFARDDHTSVPPSRNTVKHPKHVQNASANPVPDRRRAEFVNAQMYQLERQVCVQSVALNALEPRAAELEAIAIDLEEEAHAENNSSCAARAASARSRVRAAMRSAAATRTRQLELGELGIWRSGEALNENASRSNMAGSATLSVISNDKKRRVPFRTGSDSSCNNDAENTLDMGANAGRAGDNHTLGRGPPVVEVCSSEWGARVMQQEKYWNGISADRVDGGRLRSLGADLDELSRQLSDIPTHVLALIQYLVENPTAVSASIRLNSAHDNTSASKNTTRRNSSVVLEHLSATGQLTWLPDLLVLCRRGAIEATSAGAAFGASTGGPGAVHADVNNRHHENTNAHERGVGHSGIDVCERVVEAVMAQVADYVPGRAHMEQQVRVHVGRLVAQARNREYTLGGRVHLLEAQVAELGAALGHNKHIGTIQQLHQQEEEEYML